MGVGGLPSGREPKFVSEYVLANYAGRRVVFNAPLGPIPSELVADVGEAAAIRLYRSWRPRVDAIIWDDDGVVLLEGKIDTPRNAIGDLLFYRPLWGVTPEYRPFWSAPLRLVLLTPWAPDWLEVVAKAYDVEMEIYTPGWLDDRLHNLQRYHTAEWRQKREARRAALAALGLE